MNDERIFGIPRERWDAVPDDIRQAIIQQGLGLAGAAHAAHSSETDAAEAQTWNAAQSVVRYLMATNAGALVAILAFLGAMIQAKAALWLPPLVVALCVFLAGLLLAIAAGFAAFFAGSLMTESLKDCSVSYEPPYVFGTDQSNAKLRRYDCWRMAGIVLTIASAICILVASASFLNFAVVALRM